MFRKAFFILAVIALIWFYQGKPLEPSQTETTQNQKNSPKAKEKDPVTPPRRPNSFLIRNTDDFILRYPGRWQFRRGNDGAIKTITGGLISTGSFKALGDELRPLLAKGNYDLVSKGKTAASSRIQTTKFEQKVGDLYVYQGAMTILSRKSDDKAYIINNELKEITEFEKNPGLPLLNAQNIVANIYPEAEITPPSSTIIFALNGKPSELAWVFNVDLKSDFKEVVVSALDGRVLHEEPKTVHD